MWARHRRQSYRSSPDVRAGKARQLENPGKNTYNVKAKDKAGKNRFLIRSPTNVNRNLCYALQRWPRSRLSLSLSDNKLGLGINATLNALLTSTLLERDNVLKRKLMKATKAASA